jgi:transposase
MAAPYSVDLRRRVVDAYERGEGTLQEVAELFELGRATVDRWVSRFRRTGSYLPAPPGGGWKSPIDEDGLELLEELVAEKPDRTIAELTTLYVDRAETSVSTAAVSRALLRAGLTRKKKLPCDRARHRASSPAPQTVSEEGLSRSLDTPRVRG